MSNIILNETTDLVFKSEKGNAVTSSLLIAEKFEKRHSDVLRSIDNLISVNAKLRSHCVLISYIDTQGKQRPMYILDRDGFTFVTMGFTGEKACNFKWEFIEQFNNMEEIIRTHMLSQLPDFTNPAEAARAWAIEYEAKEKALKEVNIKEKIIQEQKPLVEFANKVGSSSDVILIR